MSEAHAAGKAIFMATPATDPNRRMRSEQDVQESLQRPWLWLSSMADMAEASSHAAIAGKIALACFLWNRMLIAHDPAIEFGALVAAPERVEAHIYETGVRCLMQLPLTHQLAGDWRGQFLVEDSRQRVATGLILLHDKGVLVAEEAHRTAAAILDRGSAAAH